MTKLKKNATDSQIIA